MTTRRELEQAVIEAANVIDAFPAFDPARGLPGGFILAVNRLRDATGDLRRAPPQPDLAALNAAVAQAVEEYDRTLYRFEGEIRNALDARHEALKPKPRYRAAHNGVIIDDNLNIPMLAEEVAALLNAKEKP
jgi:hypothetical protein